VDDLFGDYEPDGLSILLAGRLVAGHLRGLEPGRLIRALRRGANLSQAEFARRARFRQARVSDIEAGRVDPRWSEIRRLVAAVHVEPVLLAAGARAKTLAAGSESVYAE